MCTNRNHIGWCVEATTANWKDNMWNVTDNAGDQQIFESKTNKMAGTTYARAKDQWDIDPIFMDAAYLIVDSASSDPEADSNNNNKHNAGNECENNDEDNKIMDSAKMKECNDETRQGSVTEV